MSGPLGGGFFDSHCIAEAYLLHILSVYRARQKSDPWEKFDISRTVVIFFSKLTVPKPEDSDHIFSKFHCNICLRSKIITIWT